MSTLSMLVAVLIFAAPTAAQQHPDHSTHTFTIPESLWGLETRSDPSAVVAGQMLTSVFVDEGALVFEQTWRFYTNEPYVFLTHPSQSPGLEIRVPEGASNVRIVNPVEGVLAEAGQTGVVHYGPIGPPDTLPQEQATLVIQFVVQNADSSYRFEQVMPTDLDNVAVVVPQATMFHSDVEIDVQLLVPLCELSTDTPDAVCFPDPSTPGLSQPNPYPIVPNRIAGRGSGRAGSRLVFVTDGWPTSPTYSKTTALTFGAVVIVAFLIGLPVLTRRKRNAGVKEPNRRQLTAERQWLLTQLTALNEAYENGSVPLSEFSMNDLLLRHRLDEVYADLGLEPEKS